MHYGKRMKKIRLKRIIAASLAVLMACPALPAVRAEAAAPYVSLRTTFKTLKVGQKNLMTLKNNTIGWKVTKAATNDRTIAMVYGRTESGFYIKGKSVGRTTVKAKLKTTARKKFTTKMVRCRVNVVEAEETAENATEAVVSTQAELLKVLANRNLRKLSIQTNEPQKFQIPAGTYPGVELTVNAPASDVENSGVFQSITIEAIKSDTWVEKAVGNVMKVLAETARIVVDKGACLERVVFARVDAKVKLEVNGKVNEVSISAKMELSISGKPEAPINTTIEESAAGTVLVSEAPVNVTAYASAEITLNEGAEDSTVNIKSKDADVKVSNNTTSTITITRADGTVERRTSNRSVTSSGSFRGPSVSTPSVVTGPAVNPTGPAIDSSGTQTNPSQSGGGGWIDPGVSGPPVPSEPSGSDISYIMQPKVLLTISRSALEANTVTSMSAVLEFGFDPSRSGMNLPGIPLFTCPAMEQDTATSAAIEKVEIKSEEFYRSFESLEVDEAIAVDVSLIYRYDSVDGDFVHKGKLVVFDQTMLARFINYMDEQELTEMELELPLHNVFFDSGASYITYSFREEYIKSSS